MPTTRGNWRLGHFMRRYPEFRKLYRTMEKLYTTTQKGKFALSYLKRCREEKVLPKNLLPTRVRDLVLPFSEIDSNFLNKVINEKKRSVENNFFRFREQLRLLNSELPNEVSYQLMNVVKIVNSNYLKNYKHNLDLKLKRLFKRSKWCLYSDYEKNVLNLSSYRPSHDERIALGYGLKFANTVSTPVNTSHIQSTISACRDDREDFAFLMGLLVGNSSKHSRNIWPKRLTQALANLKKNKRIKITKSD